MISSQSSRVSGFYFSELSIEDSLLLRRSLLVCLNDVRLVYLLEKLKVVSLHQLLYYKYCSTLRYNMEVKVLFCGPLF